MTGQVDMPVQTKLGFQLQIRHMATYNEKADAIMPQQMRKFKEEANHHVTVVSDDTDMLVLLFYCYSKEGWKEDMFLAPLDESRIVISVKKQWKAFADTF